MDYNMLDPNPSIPFEGSTTQYNPPYMMGDKPFECNVCFKRFSQKAHLTTHRRTHTGEKPYACHICNKRFAQSSHLNTHKRIHSGEKPFYCVVCQMGFVNKKRLELHLQEAHKMESNVVGGDHGEPMPEYSMPYTDYVQDNGPAMMMHGNGMPGMMDGTHGMELAGGTGHRRKPMVVNRFNNDDASGSMIMGLPTDIIEDSENMLSKIKDEPSCSTDESSISKLGNSSPKLDEVGGDVDKTVAAKNSEDCYNEEAASGGTEGNIDASGDEGEVASVTSESNLSGSEQSLSSAHKKSLMSQNMGQIRRQCRKRIRYTAVNNQKQGGMHQSPIGTNSRICLVNFTSDDLLTHMMSRDDVYKCDFCCIIFQDAAMYHLHRSMHDKMDIRCCNNCGKMANDRYDFIAHFLSEHK